METKFATIPAYFFHRSAEARGGYYHLIKPDENAPAEMVDKVTKLHTELNDQLHELQGSMFATTPIVADGIAYTVAACFTKLTASGERPRLQMLAVAVATGDLKNQDIDPMEFAICIRWQDFGTWKSFDQYACRLTNQTVLSVSQSDMAEELLSRHRGESEAFRTLSPVDKAAVLSRVIRTRPANERYELTLAYDLPDNLIFPIEPALSILRAREIPVDVAPIAPAQPPVVPVIAKDTPRQVSAQPAPTISAAGKLDMSPSMSLGQLFFSFRGRISRSTFWLAYLYMLVPYCGIASAYQAVSNDGATDVSKHSILSTFANALYLFTLYLTICIQVKRWHDIGKSGWMVFLSVIPCFNLYVFLFKLGMAPGEPFVNKYGGRAPRVRWFGK